MGSDAGGGVTVAERVRGDRHAGEGRGVRGKAADFGENAVGPGSDQQGIAGVDRFGPFGPLAQDEQRDPEGGSLLLNSA